LEEAAIERCGQIVSAARNDGVIRGVVSQGRMEVDEVRWAELSPAGQSNLMGAAACDSWKTASPPPGQKLTAYGQSTGRRLATIMGIRQDQR